MSNNLFMAFDYELWWRIYNNNGVLGFVDELLAVNRIHALTKTRNNRVRACKEAIKVLEHHYRRVPIKWRLTLMYEQVIWVLARNDNSASL